MSVGILFSPLGKVEAVGPFIKITLRATGRVGVGYTIDEAILEASQPVGEAPNLPIKLPITIFVEVGREDFPAREKQRQVRALLLAFIATLDGVSLE